MLEWTVSAAALTALVIALRYLLRGRVSLRLQYALWGLVLLRLLLPVSFGSAAVSVGNLAREPARLAAVRVADAPTYDDARDQVAGEYARRGVDISQLPPAEREAVDKEIRQRMDTGLSLGGLLFGLWLGGVGAVGAALAISNLRFAAKLRRSRARLEVPQCRLPVYVSPQAETPCLFGLLRPAIYLTPQAAADDVMRRHAVAHELTHFRHGDHVWSILRGVCLALHWYDPLVWWAAVLSRNDCELACDEATIRHLGEDQRAEYGRTLIAMTCQKRPALLLGATTMTGGKNSLKERIVMLAKKPKTALCTLLAVLLVAAVAAGCAFTGSKEAEDEPLVIQTELDGDLPADVVDYAVAHVQKELDYYTDELGYDITEAKLVGLTQIITDTAAMGIGQNLYRMEYRFRVADPDKVSPAGDMRMEGDCITEWGSGGQPYLLMHYDDRSEGRVWTRVCVTNEDTIQQDYGTPEMLERYGDMYTAAAMELYKEYIADGRSPANVVDRLFPSGEDAALTLHLADSGAYNTYAAGAWHAGRFRVLLEGYEWTPQEAPSTEPSDYWLTAASPDGSKVMTFYSGSGAGTVTYTDETRDLCWVATPLEYSESIARDVRLEYDNLDVDYKRIAFSLDGGAQAAAEHFVHSAYSDHMTSLAPGSTCAISDYQVIDWAVRAVSDGDDAVVGWLEYAFTPAHPDLLSLWAGDGPEETGEYKGMLTHYMEFVLELQDDGLWHCTEMGTGGCTLPEPAAPSEGATLSDAEVEAARQAAMDYYAGGVFEVSALTALTPDTAPFWEGEIVFRVTCSKGGEAQPDRAVALERQGGVWAVINEGY